jgi:hypothetical protein
VVIVMNGVLCLAMFFNSSIMPIQPRLMQAAGSSHAAQASAQSIDVQSDEGMKHRIAVGGSALAATYDRQAEDEIAQGLYQTLDDDADLEELIPRGRSNSPALIHARTV